MKHIVIIGNGIAGITAARHIRKLSNHKITIISKETEFFFSRTALMYVYMGHMKFEHTQPYENWFWKKNRLELIQDYVETIDTDNKSLQLIESGKISYDILIIATGSKPNKFGWPGQDGKGVQGLYSKQDLDSLESHAPNNKICKRAVIVGGGLIGIELAEMFHSRNIPVTFLVREESFWNNVLPNSDSELINEEIKRHHIDLRLNTNLQEILLDENGKVKGVVLKESGETLPCDLVGLTAGVKPNIEFIKNSKIETEKGVLINECLETNIKDVYAIGDCAQHRHPIGHRPEVEAVWYTGRIMGETVAKTICGKRTVHQPGHWFNSAKFFRIEYQTYGWVFSKPKQGNTHLHWQNKDYTKCITIEYQNETTLFMGINAFGIRLRHEIFNQWLNEKRTVDYIIENMSIANFDPEFYKNGLLNIQNELKNQLQNKVSLSNA
ncbi:NAD(P)/FAD-dependent oxidoreductase [Aegicerativicinus sediminis]|uniref:NAD(P)/FAD-dependent oxidoreductase n=1 Tax=Aegicerativicinus sediminis TaxID=2893202 RepID=UPI001E33B499|nr:FAD/NAD(P)-binding oxidoreductase [Aegicerativicinus sediminis]